MKIISTYLAAISIKLDSLIDFAVYHPGLVTTGLLTLAMILIIAFIRGS